MLTTRVRGTPSGRWRRRDACELTGAPACAGMACARYAFEPRPGISAAVPRAAAAWELRQYREATRREGARDADADAPPPAHLLLCCVRCREHGANVRCAAVVICRARLLTWRCAAPETPQPSESDESDEADEALAAVLLGDVPSLA